MEDARLRSGASFIAAHQYSLAAELARDLHPDVLVVAIGPRWSSFNLPAAAVDGMTGILVEPEGRTTPIDERHWRMAAVGTAARETGGGVIETYQLYRIVPNGAARAVRLPRPAIN